jgi:hypothetical protein
MPGQSRRKAGRQACDHRVDLVVRDCHQPPAKPVQRPEFEQTDATASRKKRISAPSVS